MKRPRIIPCLLISNKNLIKTIQYRNPQYLGDPINAIKIFNEKMVDELCVLDVTATKEGKPPDIEYLTILASEAFMPLSYGGGVTSKQEALDVVHAGFEKVVIGTAFFKNPNLVHEVSQTIGSQSVVVSIDVKQTCFGSYRVWYKNGSVRGSDDVVSCCQYAESLGAGEILLNSISRDGLMNGYDCNLIKSVTLNSKIPIVACGGAGSLNDLRQVIDIGGAHAAAAGSMFVYYGKKKAVLINFPSEQDFIKEGVYES